MEYDEEHRSWSTCREQRLSAVFEMYSSLSKHPSRNKCSSSNLCIFCLLSSTKSVPMYLVTCWNYKQSHIFISPCRNDPSQLQNCRTERFFTVFEALLVTWRQRKEILSASHPKQSVFLCFFASLNASFGLMREILHRFNGCAKMWSAPGTLYGFCLCIMLIQKSGLRKLPRPRIPLTLRKNFEKTVRVPESRSWWWIWRRGRVKYLPRQSSRRGSYFPQRPDLPSDFYDRNIKCLLSNRNTAQKIFTKRIYNAMIRKNKNFG